MAINELYAGTETVTITEWSGTTDTAGPDADTADGVFQAFVDVSALAAGDSFRFRFYEKTRVGDTQRVAYETTLSGVQTVPIWVSPALILMHGWDFTLAKTAGTDRVLLWSIRQVA